MGMTQRSAGKLTMVAKNADMFDPLLTGKIIVPLPENTNYRAGMITLVPAEVSVMARRLDQNFV
jgi:hypothetical protein